MVATSACHPSRAVALGALSLLLLAAFSAGFVSGSTPPPERASLVTFSDGSSSKTVTFSGCADFGTDLLFDLPSGAFVEDATVRVGFGLLSTAPVVQLTLDVGADLVVDTSLTLTAPLAQTINLGPAGFNAFLAFAAGENGSIPAPSRACASVGTAVLVFDQVNVTYWLGSTQLRPPVVLSTPPDLEVLAGATVLRALDLTPYFSEPDGELLSFHVWPINSEVSNSTGIRVAVNGSIVEIYSMNASYIGEFGEPLAYFYAADPLGLVGKAQPVVIHIRPRAPLVPTNVSLTFAGGTAGYGLSFSHQFRFPADAAVNSASFWLTSDLNASVMESLATTISIGGANYVLATVEPADLPLWVELNASALNEMVAARVSNGFTYVDIGVTLESHGGMARVTIENVTVNLTRYPAPPLPPVTGITIDGSNATAVDADSPLVLSVVVDGRLAASYQVEWFIDGVLTREGATVHDVRLSPGQHTVEVRVSNETNSTSYSVQVEATARLTPQPGGPWLMIAITLAGAGAVGAVVAGTQAGRWLVLGVLLGSVFTRLKRDSLLDHFVRGTLYQVIREEPGVHFAELRRRAQLSNGSASHHLRTLEKGGYVRVVIDGTKTRFYTTDRTLDKEVYGISDTDKAVLEAVTETPGIGQHDLTARVNKSPATVSRSVSRLVSLGYVTTSKDGANVLVFPRPGAELVDPLAPAWPDEGN